LNSLYEAFAIVSFFFLFQELIIQDGNVSERSELLTEKEKKKKVGHMTMKGFRVSITISSTVTELKLTNSNRLPGGWCSKSQRSQFPSS
jgi:hypothetical protein